MTLRIPPIHSLSLSGGKFVIRLRRVRRVRQLRQVRHVRRVRQVRLLRLVCTFKMFGKVRLERFWLWIPLV